MKKILSVLLLTLIIATLAGPIPAHAVSSVLYVKTTASGSGNCSSWANACTLQTALAQAQATDEIWVQTGVYKPGAARTDSFALKNGVALYGGFFGNELSRDARDWLANPTILSGDIDNNDINTSDIVIDPADIRGANAYHVVVSTGVDNTTVLDGFTITAGQANVGSEGRREGAGLYNNGGNPTIRNVVFQGNMALADGGGMYNDAGSPILINVFFIRNSAGWGAGLHNNVGGSPNITNAVFFKNVASNGGGGIYNKEASSATIFNASFYGNQVTSDDGLDGGGIFLDNSSVTITNTIIWGNIINPDSDQSRAQIAYRGASSHDVAYSIVQGGWPGNVYNNLDADPRFVNAEGGNLKLQGASPAIDSGTNTDCPAEDIEGTVRPQQIYAESPVCDMGAYERELSSLAKVNVEIGGNSQGLYYLTTGEERRLYYPISGGPVIVTSEDGDPIVSAIRLQSYTNNILYSFVETMGVPQGSLSHKYYFPTYNNTWAPLNSQLRFGNLNSTAIKVKVTIGTSFWVYDVPANSERREYLPVSGGPVIIESLDPVTQIPDPTKKIVAAIRLQSYVNDTLHSFAETMGIPTEKLSDVYYFPTYNNTWGPLNSQLRFGNLNNVAIKVRVTIGTSSWVYDVPANSERREYLPVSGGPVVIQSLDAVTENPDPTKKIIAAIRLQSYINDTLYSFVETMGVPAELLSHQYYFPTYNNTWGPLNSQVRFGNLNATTTRIRVTIGGVNVWEQDVPGLEERRLYFNVSGGPVIIESLDINKKIVAAIRLQSYTNDTLYSFSETMGIPEALLSDTYYFPTYNNTWAPLNSQLRFGVP